MLEVSDLEKRYGDIVAVNDISLTVEEGEFFSIVGPSGSGKSTLLRCIGGLEAPQEGKIFLDGKDVTRDPAYDRDTTTVFQNLALFPHMTVRENIEYGMKRQGIEKSERTGRVEEYLELVDLPGYADREINQLSGGEKQRVALARSLVIRPKLMLLDEPLASLDQQLRVQLQNELFELQRTLDQTSIYVTHDQNVALSISDRVAVMNDGRIEQVGQPYELYENPNTEFVARFIGDSNRFTGTATEVRNGTVAFEIAGTDRTVRGRALDTVDEGSPVSAVIKVEDFDIKSPDEYPNTLQGEIERISYRGRDTKLMLDVDEVGIIEVYTEELSDFDVGKTIEFGWSEEDCATYAGGV